MEMIKPSVGINIRILNMGSWSLLTRIYEIVVIAKGMIVWVIRNTELKSIEKFYVRNVIY